ncbi:serine/threonine-protein kinase [Solimonas sp. K1W22B-7]|uniref:serine/threonine-protein kinase n=1 Tax=Solimonas sp. K1W22B-7 TaxID=2303331 RepID=UPI001F08D390|nr:serine/threonine-protein kinase [Solimonas sp. K1W22B-7]
MQLEKSNPVTKSRRRVGDTEVSAIRRPADLPDSPPQQIAKYEIRGELGRGACGVVYKAFDPFVQRDVAIKVAMQDQEFRSDVDHERTFFAEARAAGMLSHKHIVSLYDAGVEGELSYLVMEYIDGETLQPMCRPGGLRLPLDQVIDIVFKCAKALDYAHSKGILHRDIKPSNIMLTRDGVPKLMDFSIAEIGHEASSTKHAGGGTGLLGSPLYMSPEQSRNEQLDGTSDLYSLGAVMFQLLTGRPPFPMKDMKELLHAINVEPAPRVRDLRPDVPAEVSNLVSRLLLKNPDERYRTGGDLAGALARLYDLLKLAGHTVGRRESRDSLRRLHFFDGFSDEDINEILNVSSMATYQPGEALITESGVDAAFFIIALGTAEVQKGGRAIYRLEKGDCMGEIGFVSGAKRSGSVVALNQVLALKLNASAVGRISERCQLRFYKVFTETLIYRLSMASARISAMNNSQS